MVWLKTLVPILLGNKHVRSALLSLAGGLAAIVTQWASGIPLDAGSATLISGTVATLVNAVKEWLASPKKKPAEPVEPDPEPLDLSPLARAADDDVPFCWLLLAGLTLAFVGSGVALAEKPRAVIQGADPSLSGEIAVFDASASEFMPQHFSWDIQPELSGRRQLMPVEDGRKIVVATFPGTYLLSLTVSNADGHSTAHRQLIIPGAMPPNPAPQPIQPQPLPQPQPQPVPEPQPPSPPIPRPTPFPEPVFPHGQFGMAASTYDVALAVNSVNRASEAACLATRCGELIAEIDDQEKTLAAPTIVSLMAGALDSCTNTAWDAARLKLTAKIAEFHKAGQLRTEADWRSLVDEMRQGLSSVK